ncbi:MAG TPA: CotH kinase family protein [Prolixibacteraceae bacterium]|nr:CotH kinase family protein [Prolixibacteraceae bacterium]
MIKKLYLSLLLLLGIFAGAYAQINFNSSAPFKYLKGSDAAGLPADWMTSTYTPAGWSDGYMPYRMNYTGGGTLLSDMLNNYSTIYLRSTFNAQNVASLKDVVFSVNFDDGFAIWINGEQVFGVNVPLDLSPTSVATGPGQPGTFKTYKLPAHDITLKEGENLIAIQCLNLSKSNSDFYFDMRLNAELPLPQTSDTIKAVFSQPNGFYTSPFNLKLDVPDPSYTLVYTIDGSNPQNSSTAIIGGTTATINVDPSIETGRPKTPCFIVRASLKKGTLAPSFPLTQTYIFLDQVMTQTYPGDGWPQQGSIYGQTIDLDMDPDITQSATYASQMKDAMTSIPSISVVTDLEDLFGEMGIYVNAWNHGENWERFSSVEIINPSGTPGFNINAGLRIRGGWSRHDNFPKHAFRLFFRDEYGAPKLKFPLFETEGVSEFDKIDLRCEQNYSWAHPPGDDQARNTAVREVFSRDTQRDMGWPYTRSRYYHLYLNGMYWGLYQTQERAEARFAADYLGGSKEDYDVIKVGVDAGGIEATDGNMDSWQKIYNLTTKGFASNADYFALEGKDQYGYPKKGGEVIINLDNLIDYMQLIFYTGNFDSPVSAFNQNLGANNFYAIDKRDDRSTGFLFFSHDAEHSLMITPEGPGKGIEENRVAVPGMSPGVFSRFNPQWLNYRLTSNEEYKLRFADRAYKNFYNNGVFTPEASHARFAKRVAEVTKAIVGESARWGDTFKSIPFSWDDWNNEINDIYNRFFPERTDIVINQLKAAGLLPSFNPPVITMNNVQLTKEAYPVTGSYQVTLSSATGQIFYTPDGTDPRAIGGQVNSSAIEIPTGGAVNLNGTAYIKARVKNGTQWSALSEVKLLNTNENFDHLKITELHYHPTDSIIDTLIISGKSFEFIELKNTGDQPINLAGLRFSSSIDYQFKENDVLAPKQFYVIASKPKWFYERHFMVPTGNFNKNFSNSGEQVVLSNASGSPVIQFTYLDYNPWPQQPDGDGPSLSAAVRYPSGDPNDATYWKASAAYDGTPFADDSGIVDTIDDPTIDNYQVAVFPNPTKGLLYLKVNNADAEINVEITSLSGSKLYQSSVAGKNTLNLQSLNINPGIYLVKTRYKDHLSVHKVVYQP